MFYVFYVHFLNVLCPNEISEAFITFGIKCLGIALSWIQVWCKRFEGDRRYENFRLLT